MITSLPVNNGSKGSMFYIGDDRKAKRIAEQVIHDSGFDPLDAGPLANARLLESFGLFMGRLGFAHNP